MHHPNADLLLNAGFYTLIVSSLVGLMTNKITVGHKTNRTHD